MSDDFVTIFQSTDTVQTNLIENIMMNHGIPVRGLGTRRGAAVGSGQNICSSRFEVPRDFAEQSVELIEQLQSGDYAVEADTVVEQEPALV